MQHQSTHDHWLPADWHTHPAFHYLDKAIVERLKQQHSWPAVGQYTHICKQAPLPFIEQDSEAVKTAGGYECYIHQHQSIPTRPNNRHDFMNALTWHHFPQSKLCLHQLQSNESQKQQSTGNNRSRLQNICTLFDECGIILISQNKYFMELIRSHAWETVFLKRRAELRQETRLVVFGHALLEKSLNPYIGMCGKLVYIPAPTTCSVHRIDQLLARHIESTFTQTDAFPALPLLGYPGWHSDNDQRAFYTNTDYFRPLRTS